MTSGIALDSGGRDKSVAVELDGIKKGVENLYFAFKEPNNPVVRWFLNEAN